MIIYDNLKFLFLRFCPKFCLQILRWNFGFSKQRSVCTFPSTLFSAIHFNLLKIFLVICTILSPTSLYIARSGTIPQLSDHDPPIKPSSFHKFYTHLLQSYLTISFFKKKDFFWLSEKAKCSLLKK